MIVEITVLSLFVLFFIACLTAELVAPTSSLSTWMMENIWDVNKTLVSLKSHVPVLINSLIYIVIVCIISFGIKLMERRLRKGDR